RSRLIDCQCPAIDLFSIELRDSLVSILDAHLDETKTLRTASITVRDNVNWIDLANLFKKVAEIAFCRLERQISNVNSFAHSSPKHGYEELPKLAGKRMK